MQRKKISSITVAEHGLTFYLSKNEGKVYKKTGEENFLFYISSDDLENIEKIYLKNKLYNLKDEAFYESKTKFYRYPTNITTITIEFQNKKKEITYQDDGFQNDPLNRIPDEKVREFFISTLKIVQKIKDSTKIRSDIN